MLLPNARWLPVALSVLLPMAVQAQDKPRPVPPEKAARPLSSVTLVNPGFESTNPGQLGAPEGWWAVQHAGPKSYTFTLDPSKPRSGKHSMKVENVGPEPFGNIFQKLDARPYRGGTLRFAAWVRTEGTTGNPYGAGAGLTLFAMRGGYPIAHVTMSKDGLHGTVDWARYEVVLRVPVDADHIEAGLSLFGGGVAWIDDVALDVVDASLALDPLRAGTVREVK